NYDLYKSRAANWRDTLSISTLVSEDLDPNEVPKICRLVVSGGQESHVEMVLEYDQTKELQAFDETKAGVKGLIDNGVAKVPKNFVRPAEELAKELSSHRAHIQVPVIDLGGIERLDRRKEIVNEIKTAAAKWGFFPGGGTRDPCRSFGGND
ncbi:hypothetical protein RJ639_044028, partial [Escallonia herrerae]